MHNSKKCSNFAAETEDGVAGGAHAESIISRWKALHTPSIEVSHVFYIKAFIGACFGVTESGTFQIPETR